MRILGAVLVMVLLTACDGGSSQGADDVSTPATQEEATLDALRSAAPAMTSALNASSSGFNGTHLPCRLGNNSFEYTVNGGIAGDAASWKGGLAALEEQLSGAGWSLEDTVNDVSVAGTRQGVELFVQRQRRTDDGVAWTVKLTAPCVTFSDEDTAAVRGRGTVDLSDQL